MMKIIIALALVALCQAGPLATRLSTPDLYELTIRDENFLLFEFQWTGVQSGLWSDPVIGYKMRVWEVPDEPLTKARQFPIHDGKYIVQMEKQQDGEKSLDETKSLQNILLEEIRTPADLLRGAFFNVRINVNYEIRVAAYTQTAHSLYSNYWRIRVLPAAPPAPSNSESITITSEDLKL